MRARCVPAQGRAWNAKPSSGGQRQFRIDARARFGNRLEQSGLHAGFRHTVAHRGLGELAVDLHAVKSSFERGLVNARKIAATAEQPSIKGLGIRPASSQVNSKMFPIPPIAV